MTRIQRMDEILRDLTAPVLNNVESLSIAAGDVLIICAGFEDRSIYTLKNALSSGVKDFFVLVVDYLPFIEANQSDEIEKMCKAHNIHFDRVIYDRQNPINGGELCLSRIPEDRKHLWIDISGMSRLLIVQIVVALLNNATDLNSTSIVYVEAKEYPPTEETVNKAIADKQSTNDDLLMFLSSGVFDVSIVPELSSVAMQSQPVRLVSFPSLNPHQLIALRSVLQPSYLTIINGIPPAQENKWRTQAIRTINNVDKITNREEVATSTLDYRETYSALLDIYGRYGAMEKLVISPVGSKMQTVAVGLFRAYLDDIQIAYPTPRSFTQPKEYTKGVKQMYTLCLADFPSRESI